MTTTNIMLLGLDTSKAVDFRKQRERRLDGNLLRGAINVIETRQKCGLDVVGHSGGLMN